MSSAKKPLIFIIFTGALCWAVFTSWRPQIESYAIKGKVVALYGDVANAKIKYTQDSRDMDFGKMKEIDVTAKGSFASVINIKPHGPVYFYVVKDGYTTARHQQILSNPDADNKINTISISSLHKGLSIRQKLNKEYAPTLELYQDGCLANLDEQVSINDIFYFENIRSLAKSVANCGLKPNEARLSAKLNIAGTITSNSFFKLTRRNSGEVLLPSPPASKASFTSYE